MNGLIRNPVSQERRGFVLLICQKTSFRKDKQHQFAVWGETGPLDSYGGVR
jgi:hypothetical protein